jgi:hypothetical protein
LAACKQSLEDNQWHHIVGVYDGKRIVLYVDGEEKDAVTASGTVRVNNAPVTLGENAVNRGRHFGGWLDDARLYARGLSAEEIKALHRERIAWVRHRDSQLFLARYRLVQWLGEKVGNLRRGGRLGRVKPIFRRIKPLDGTSRWDSESLWGKPMRGRVSLASQLLVCRRPWCWKGETPGEAESQESNVLLSALNKRMGVTALRLAQGPEAGSR